MSVVRETYIREAHTALHKSEDTPRLVQETVKSQAPGSRDAGTTPIGAGKNDRNYEKIRGSILGMRHFPLHNFLVFLLVGLYRIVLLPFALPLLLPVPPYTLVLVQSLLLTN